MIFSLLNLFIAGICCYNIRIVWQNYVWKKPVVILFWVLGNCSYYFYLTKPLIVGMFFYLNNLGFSYRSYDPLVVNHENVCVQKPDGRGVCGPVLHSHHRWRGPREGQTVWLSPHRTQGHVRKVRHLTVSVAEPVCVLSAPKKSRLSTKH